MNRELRLLAIISAVCVAVIVMQQPLQAATNESTCAQFGVFSVDAGNYNVQNNAFNLRGRGQQCLFADSAGTDWSETTTNSVRTGSPGGYPSIYAGCHWGDCSSNQHGMPILESSITSVPTAWSVTPSTSGKWDISYDIWFNTTPTTNACPNGLEIMVWLNEAGPRPAGSQVATVIINNMTWQVWFGTGGCGSDVSYMATTPVNSVNFDLLPFFRDAVSRGYLNPSWYLIDVEAGTEIWTPGSNFRTNSFSVSVQ